MSVIQSLWIGEQLTVMEKLSISSFLKNGHTFNLYVYNEVKGIPEGVTIKDANKIIPAQKIFKYKNYNSYAGFANLFRYKLLFEKGGYWVDTDVICLKKFNHDIDYVFAAERTKKTLFRRKLEVCNCIIKVPKESKIMKYCFDEASKENVDDLKWGQTGPLLLTKAIKKLKMKSFVKNPEVFCPIDWWDWRQIILEKSNTRTFNDSDSIHLWNEMWRRDKIDKSANFPKSSLYETLKKKYL